MTKKRSKDEKDTKEKSKKSKGEKGSQDVNANDVFNWLKEFLEKNEVIEVKNNEYKKKLSFYIVGIDGKDSIKSIGYKRNSKYYPKLTDLLIDLRKEKEYFSIDIEEFKKEAYLLLPKFGSVGSVTASFPFKCLIPREKDLEPFSFPKPKEVISEIQKNETKTNQTVSNKKENSIFIPDSQKIDINQNCPNFMENLELTWINLWKTFPNNIQKSIQEKLFPTVSTPPKPLQNEPITKQQVNKTPVSSTSTIQTPISKPSTIPIKTSTQIVQTSTYIVPVQTPTQTPTPIVPVQTAISVVPIQMSTQIVPIQTETPDVPVQTLVPIVENSNPIVDQVPIVSTSVVIDPILDNVKNNLETEIIKDKNVETLSNDIVMVDVPEIVDKEEKKEEMELKQ